MSQLILPGSQALKQIIEQHGWSLHYALQPAARMEPFTWDEIGMNETEVFHFWESYIFLPQPKGSQSYAAAFAQARYDGNFPVLKFRKQEKKRNMHLSGPCQATNFDLYFLTHLILKEHEAIAMSYPMVYPPYSSRVSMPIDTVVNVFAKHFAIATFDENGEPRFKTAKHLN